MIAVRETVQDDLVVVCRKSRQVDRVLLDEYGEERVRKAAICHTIVVGDEPIAIFGGSPPTGVGLMYVWAVVTDGARGHGLALFREARRMMKDWHERPGVRRLFSWAPELAHENIKWMELLGFKRCEVLDYFDGSTFWKGYDQ